MSSTYIALCAAAMSTFACAVLVAAEGAINAGSASPLYGVTMPEGDRHPALEAKPLNEPRAVLGSGLAIRAYADRTLPFTDETVFAKLASRHVQSPEFESASTPASSQPRR
jgi:hypothetical protein